MCPITPNSIFMSGSYPRVLLSIRLAALIAAALVIQW